MSKLPPNKRLKTIVGYYKPIDDIVKSYSMIDPELMAILGDARKGIIYSKPSDIETKELKDIKDELYKTVNGMKNTLDPEQILKLGAKADVLEESKEKISLVVHDKLSKVRTARNWLSKAMQCQLYYTHKSKFALSAQWIIILNQIKAVLNDNEELQNTSDATKPDVIDVEAIDNRNEHVANKEVEVMNVDNITAATGFHHGIKLNQGLLRKKMLSNEGRQTPKKGKKATFIQYSQFMKYLNGGPGKTGKAESLDGHGFVWENGVILCMTCNGKNINEPRRMQRHILSTNHKNNIDNLKESKVKTTVTITQLKSVKGDNERQHSVTPEIQAYRCEALRQVGKANISLSSFGNLSAWIDKNSQSNLSLGYATDLPRSYAETVLGQLIKEIRDLSLNCFPEYGIIFDGTPSFAEAEAIKLRFVTYEYEIVEVLVRVALFEKKLNGDNIASHLLETIMLRLGLRLEDWYTSQQDRASTNSAAIKKIKEMHKNATPTENYCNTHTLSNAGNVLIKMENIPNCFNFRKRYQKIIQYPGKAKDLAKRCYKTTVCGGSGVRFFLHYEQITQIVTYGLENVIKNIARVSAENKWSEKSSKKILKEFDNDNNRGKLAMAMFEGAVVKDAGKLLCTSAYTLEGDSPLILTAHEVFEKIDKCSNDGFELPSLLKAAEYTSRILLEVYAPLESIHRSILAELENAEQEKEGIEPEIENIRKELDDTANQTSSRGRTSRRSNIVIDQDKVESLNMRLNEAEIRYDARKKGVEEVVKKLRTHEIAMDRWNRKFPNKTVNDLVRHGKNIAKPALDYYRSNFNDEGGDMYNLKRASKACQIFNPFVLKEVSINLLELLVDDLQYFEYRCFTKEFLNRMKKELPLAIEHANKMFDWESIKPSKQYETRLDRKIKRKKLDKDHNFDWKMDAGEKACRIFEWWKVRFTDTTMFTCFRFALRLVVLSQMSSCSVERVFSQLKLVRETCGENMMEDMTEIRMFMRCNGDLNVSMDK